MSVESIDGIPQFACEARERLHRLGDGSVVGAGAFLSRLFPGRDLFSTLYDGERAEDLSREVRDDLRDLAKALPAGAISTDQTLRDQFSGEPRGLSFVRQLEGSAPAPLAVITAGTSEEAAEAVGEARAMGFTLAPGPRQVVLRPTPSLRIVDRPSGNVVLSASASWEDLINLARPAGLNPLAQLRGVFSAPIAAARAGLFGRPQLIERFGQVWAARLTLPPDSVELAQRAYFFADGAMAETLLPLIVRRFSPLFAETIPVVEAGLARAAGLASGPKLLDAGRGTVLRLVFAGPSLTRMAALTEAGWQVRDAGGRRIWREIIPGGASIDALTVAAGAMRLERQTGATATIPASACVSPRMRAVDRHITTTQMVLYPRDLSRSVEEAKEILGLIPPRREADVPIDVEVTDPAASSGTEDDRQAAVQH